MDQDIFFSPSAGLILTPSSFERSSADIFLVKHAPSAHDRPDHAMAPRLA
jgi:hypothetical protein